MRPIKFRGKRVYYGNWVFGDLNQHYLPVIIEKGVIFNSIHLETIGQYTGLKDKNGKEIYEGDIVKYYQPYLKKYDTHIVLWDEKFACFGLFEHNNEWCKKMDWIKIESIEIIGNIHDNPELTHETPPNILSPHQ